MYRTFHKLQPSTNPALAPKKPLLTKSHKPKLTDSAFADFGHNPQVSLALWHPKSPTLPNPSSQIRTQPAEFQSENRHIIPGIRLSRIPEFCAFAEKNAVFLTNQGCKGGQNGHVDRAIASGDILGQLQK